MSYSADFLLDIADSADCPRINQEHDFGDQPFPAKDGWTVVIFYDAGDLDYIAHFISPDGEEIDFWKWPESEDRERLIAWRGRKTPEELAEEADQQAFFDSLTDDERALYTARAYVAYQQAMMDSFNAMARLKDFATRLRWDLPEPIADDHPKPATPRERLRALKAHPRSARGRR